VGTQKGEDSTDWVTALSYLALKLPSDGNGIRPELCVLKDSFGTTAERKPRQLANPGSTGKWQRGWW